MNRENLNIILEQYIQTCKDEQHVPDRGRRWRAVKCFRDHWDIDAEDFASMFTMAMKEAQPVIDQKSSSPIAGIQTLLDKKSDIEPIREAFRKLFVEDDGDMDARQKRANDFVREMTEYAAEEIRGSSKFRQQLSSAIDFLAIWHPEENYFFWQKMANQWADCILYDEDFGTGSRFSLSSYYRMCDQLKEALKKNPVTAEISSRMAETWNDGMDDDFHLMVSDIITAAGTEGFYDRTTVEKMPARKRVEKAVREEKIAGLQEQLDRLLDHKKQIRTGQKEIPDLTGQSVIHKRFGEGTVLSVNNGHIRVGFAAAEKVFRFPDAFLQNFLKIDNTEYMDLFAQDKTVSEQLHRADKEIEHIRIELKGMENVG